MAQQCIKDVDGGNVHGVGNGINRVSSVPIARDSEPVETYQYLGLSTIVDRDRPEEQVDQSYFGNSGISASAGDEYTGLDRFGRVLDQSWAMTQTPARISTVSNMDMTPTVTHSTKTIWSIRQ